MSSERKILPLIFAIVTIVSLSIYYQDVYAADPVIYDDGPPVPTINFLADTFTYAEDFMLTESASITDVHFWIFDGGAFDGQVEHFVYADNAGKPGTVIATGFGVNVQTQSAFPAINCVSPPCFSISMDLENPVPLEAGVKYWFGWSIPTGAFANPASNPLNVGLLIDQSPVNSVVLRTFDGVNWGPLSNTPFGVPFSLTGITSGGGGGGGPSDTDGDGIDDDVDTMPGTPSTQFTTSSSPPTSGTITSGQGNVHISGNGDGGVTLDATGNATVDACDSSTTTLTDGDLVTLKCTSVNIVVISGPVDVVFIGDDDTEVITTLDAGDDVTFESDTLTIENNGPDPITVIVDGEEIVVPGNSSVDIDPEPEFIKVSSCQPLLEDGATYVLQQNIEKDPAPGPCFSVLANNVTIDGAGFAIISQCSEFNSAGVFLSAPDSGLTVKNLTVDGFDFGIFIFSDNNTIENNTIVNNCIAGVWLQDSDGNTINDNTFSNNGSPFDIETGQIVLLNSNGNSILRNNIQDASENGIFLLGSEDNLIDENNLSNHGKDAILIRFGDNNTVSNNSIFQFGQGNGIDIADANFNTITNNFLEGGGICEDDANGIQMTDTNGNTVSGNEIAFWSQQGIALLDVSGSTFDANNVHNNCDDGFDLDRSSNLAGSDGNTFTNNISNSNGSDGYDLEKDSDDNIFDGNTAQFNKGRGMVIEQDSDRNIVTNNVFSDNEDEGFELKRNADDNIITLNEMNRNFDSGIDIEEDSDDNIFSCNTIVGNLDTGIEIEEGAKDNMIFKNLVQGNPIGIGLYSDFEDDEFTENNIITNNNIIENDNQLRDESDLDNTLSPNYWGTDIPAEDTNPLLIPVELTDCEIPDIPEPEPITKIQCDYNDETSVVLNGVLSYTVNGTCDVTRGDTVEIKNMTLVVSKELTPITDSIEFSDFSSIDGLSLNGEAEQVGDVLRIVPAIDKKSGSAYFSEKVNISEFNTQFQMKFSDEHTELSDGLTFVIQDDPDGVNALGGDGGDLGYSEISPSVATSFDTFKNDGCDFGTNISILSNGDLCSELDFAFFNFVVDQVYTIWIDYDGTTYDVFISTDQTKPNDPIVTLDLDIADILGTNMAYVGFTAGTGGDNNNHDILNWSFNEPSNEFEQTGTFTIDFTDGSGTIVVSEDGQLSIVDESTVVFSGDVTGVDDTEFEPVPQCGNVDATVILNNDSASGTISIVQCEVTPPPEPKKSSGGDEAWKTRPTSGINYENGAQLVINGFGWNGNFLTVEFDHYQPFTKEELKIGERSTLTAKVYAPNGLMSQSFGLGIRDIGSNDAEVELRANLNIDGSIDSIEVIQKTDVVDPETLTVSNEKAYCKDGDAEKRCDEIKFAFTLQEPLQYEKAYSQHIDFKRRVGQVWVNHGFEITGEQTTPMLSNMIPSNVRNEGLLKVTQVEKYSPYWVADNHRMFEMNSFGSFKEINQSFERFQDTGTAYTRMHSGFGGIIAYEQDRALDIFDATSLVSELPASFAYIFPETGERITEEMRQEMLVQEEIAKAILDEMDKQDRHY